eukprot:scaffold1690_cov182-Amphora_coffeaeformis.AAC.19
MNSSSQRFLRQNVPDRGVAFRDDGPGLSIYATIALGLVLFLTVMSCMMMCGLRLRQRWRCLHKEACRATDPTTEQSLTEKQTLEQPPPPDFEYIQKTLQFASSYVRQYLMPSSSQQPEDDDDTDDDDINDYKGGNATASQSALNHAHASCNHIITADNSLELQDEEDEVKEEEKTEGKEEETQHCIEAWLPPPLSFASSSSSPLPFPSIDQDLVMLENGDNRNSPSSSFSRDDNTEERDEGSASP